MFKRTLLIVIAITILFGCITVAVAKDKLLVDYYITKSGLTAQIFPGDDWQYVKDMAVEEPISIQIAIVWLDWDANTLAMVAEDITSGHKTCAAWVFTDVSFIPTKDYKDGVVMDGVVMPCEAFYFGLTTALSRE